MQHFFGISSEMLAITLIVWIGVTGLITLLP